MSGMRANRVYVVRCQNCFWVYKVLPPGFNGRLGDGFMDEYWPNMRCVSCGKMTKYVAEISWQDGKPLVVWDEEVRK